MGRTARTESAEQAYHDRRREKQILSPYNGWNMWPAALRVVWAGSWALTRALTLGLLPLADILSNWLRQNSNRHTVFLLVHLAPH